MSNDRATENTQDSQHTSVHLGTCTHLSHDSQDKVIGNKKGLWVALLITTGIVGLEFWGSWLTNSLSLLSDAGHMIGDSVSLLLSLIAIYMSQRATKRIHGYTRFEIGASLFNGVTLVLLACWVIWEAYLRLIDPKHIHGILMVGIAAIGLMANLFSAWYMSRTSDVSTNLNVRSAYLHVLMDAWSSVGVIVSGIFIHYLNWMWIDPVISAILAFLIAKGGVRVVYNVFQLIGKKEDAKDIGGSCRHC
ncbi:cation diffusion facilitator family transporter [Brevibacillus sp. NPDC058079]|uniref:cation diffusion facilitator family transporter n=1 Tax=Brevibacillus sp. NPDC058079 TaxID=3346330 RepID=UPI0036EDD894